MARKYGVIFCEIIEDPQLQKSDGKEGAQNSEDPQHPDDGRRLVGVLNKTEFKKKKRQSKEQKIDYLAYPDVAIDALLKIGSTSQSHLSSLSSQRLAMTTVNLGLVTAVVTYLLGKNPAQNAGFISQQSSFLLIVAVLMGALFAFIAWSIGSAETYSYRLMIGSQQMASRHYNLAPLMREARQNYNASMLNGWLSWLLGQHTYIPFVFINLFIPIVGYAVLKFIISGLVAMQNAQGVVAS